METLGGSGRSSRWYGDPLAVLRGVLTDEDDERCGRCGGCRFLYELPSLRPVPCPRCAGTGRAPYPHVETPEDNEERYEIR